MGSTEQLGGELFATAQVIAAEARAEGFDVTIEDAVEAIRSALLTGPTPNLDLSDIWIGS